MRIEPEAQCPLADTPGPGSGQVDDGDAGTIRRDERKVSRLAELRDRRELRRAFGVGTRGVQRMPRNQGDAGQRDDQWPPWSARRWPRCRPVPPAFDERPQPETGRGPGGVGHHVERLARAMRDRLQDLDENAEADGNEERVDVGRAGKSLRRVVREQQEHLVPEPLPRQADEQQQREQRGDGDHDRGAWHGVQSTRGRNGGPCRTRTYDLLVRGRFRPCPAHAIEITFEL